MCQICVIHVSDSKKPFFFAVLGASLFAISKNPEARTYYEALVESADDMILVSDLNKNPAAEDRLRFLHTAYNEGRIRCTSLGLFSLIWLDNYHPDCGIYSSQCSYLKPSLLDFHSRIVDIGFLGKWWIIKHYMKDYDISPLEFPSK